MVIANSTISGNAASGSELGIGGGISIYSGVGYPFSSLTLINSTVADNNGSTEGGGIGNMVGAGANATTTFVNTVVADNTAPEGANCSAAGGTLTSLGYNMEDFNTCNFDQPSDQPNTNPLLGTLADNGGPTETHALLAGSPAIDAGDNSTCAAGPVSGMDQRGILRPQGLVCDVGAFEVEQPPTAVTLGDLQAQPSASAPPASVLRALAILAVLWGVSVGYCLRKGYVSQFWSDQSRDDGSNASIRPAAGALNLDGVGSIRRWWA
jgi:hypothetical protein